MPGCVLYLRFNSPATSRVGNGGCRGPTRQTEPKRPAKNSQSISAARRTIAWRRLMMLQRRAKQIVLTIVTRLAQAPPKQRISPSKEARTAQIGNAKTQENPDLLPTFLQNPILAQIKS
jgi:hypothetical protein